MRVIKQFSGGMPVYVPSKYGGFDVTCTKGTEMGVPSMGNERYRR